MVPQGKQEKVTLETKLSKYQVPRVAPSATNIILIKEMISFTRSGQRGAGKPGNLCCTLPVMHFLPHSHWRSVSTVICITHVPCARHCVVREADTTGQGFPEPKCHSNGSHQGSFWTQDKHKQMCSRALRCSCNLPVPYRSRVGRGECVSSSLQRVWTWVTTPPGTITQVLGLNATGPNQSNELRISADFLKSSPIIIHRLGVRASILGFKKEP